jgi:hypothetical protein
LYVKKKSVAASIATVAMPQSQNPAGHCRDGFNAVSLVSLAGA